MRYFFKKPKHVTNQYGIIFHTDHPLYNSCTLYRIGGKGLAVIQQRFDEKNKVTKWGPIDPELTDSIYLNPRFQGYFEEKAAKPTGSFHETKCRGMIFPTVTIRQIMWALRIKPLPKEPWETVFDRNPI